MRRGRAREPAINTFWSLDNAPAQLRVTASATPGYEHDAVALMLVEERQTIHHPGVEAAGAMARYLADDVQAILEPAQFGARGGWENCGFAIFALIAVLRYCFAIESDISVNVV